MLLIYIISSLSYPSTSFIRKLPKYFLTCPISLLNQNGYIWISFINKFSYLTQIIITISSPKNYLLIFYSLKLYLLKYNKQKKRSLSAPSGDLKLQFSFILLQSVRNILQYSWNKLQ